MLPLGNILALLTFYYITIDFNFYQLILTPLYVIFFKKNVFLAKRKALPPAFIVARAKFSRIQLGMIAFFDSGLGGVRTIAKAVHAGVKGDLLYYADVDNAPFGAKSKEEILCFLQEDVRKMKAFGARAVVLACNTASLAAEGKTFDLPVYPLCADLSHAKGEKTLFLGTNYSTRVLRERQADEEVRFLALPPLATMLDKGAPKQEIFSYLQSALKDVGEVDRLILGCTHYGAVEEPLRRLLSPKKVVDVADDVLRLTSLFPKKEKAVIYLPASQKKFARALETETNGKANITIL